VELIFEAGDVAPGPWGPPAAHFFRATGRMERRLPNMPCIVDSRLLLSIVPVPVMFQPGGSACSVWADEPKFGVGIAQAGYRSWYVESFKAPVYGSKSHFGGPPLYRRSKPSMNGLQSGGGSLKPGGRSMFTAWLSLLPHSITSIALPRFEMRPQACPVRDHRRPVRTRAGPAYNRSSYRGRRPPLRRPWRSPGVAWAPPTITGIAGGLRCRISLMSMDRFGSAGPFANAPWLTSAARKTWNSVAGADAFERGGAGRRCGPKPSLSGAGK